MFCLALLDVHGLTTTKSQSPVEDHRCSAPTLEPTPLHGYLRHSPLSRIIVVLPRSFTSGKLLGLFFVTVPCRGSSLFCRRRRGFSPRHRVAVTVPCRGSSLFCRLRLVSPTPLARNVTVPCRGSSLFCLVLAVLVTLFATTSQSPVEDHRCSALSVRRRKRQHHGQSQSPVEDHRCSASALNR